MLSRDPSRFFALRRLRSSGSVIAGVRTATFDFGALKINRGAEAGDAVRDEYSPHPDGAGATIEILTAIEDDKQ